MREIDDIERLKRINAALMSRVERAMDQQGNAFSLFQTAINLESRVKLRTEELRSTLRRLERSNIDLADAKENAERANTSKTRFLAAASHDVLQPLNAALLSVSALADLQSGEEGRRLVRQVERSLETMGDLLRTLLDISKLDAGVILPEWADVALDPLFASLKSDFQPLADKKGIRLRFRATELAAVTDRTLLRRILQNVVSNAIRYTSAGGVLVAARRRGASLRIDVYDTGSGIPDDERDEIFEEFHRGTASAADLTGGLGLGLSIVRRMVEALGHGLTFSSVVGRGTVFRLSLPLSVTPEVPSAPPDPEPPRAYGLFGARVLLVENDEEVAEATTALLERWRCTVRSAATADGAIDALGDTDWIPDVIIADQHLDHGDLGSEAIAEARAFLMRQVPAVIVTADPSDQLQRSARKEGIEVMLKPVKPAQLRALLAHLLA